MTNTHANKSEAGTSQAVAHEVAQQGEASALQLRDNRTAGSTAGKKLREMAANSPQGQRAVQVKAMTADYSHRLPVQRKKNSIPQGIQFKSNTPVNDDPALEQEADKMGAKALGVEHAVQTEVKNTPLNNASAPVQMTIQEGTRALSRTSAPAAINRAFRARFRRDPGPAEQAELQRLITLYVADNMQIRTVARVLDEMVANLRAARQEGPSSTVTVREERSGHSQEPTDTSGGPTTHETTGRPEPLTTTSPLEEDRSADTRITTHSTTEQREPVPERSGTGRDAPRELRLGTDTATHVGFEIEVGGSYTFPIAARDTLTRVMNRTLFECVVNDRVVLEMLLDDMRSERRTIRAQVEFRTTPQNFEDINEELGAVIRTAISRFPTSIFRTGEPAEFTAGRGVRGLWRPTALFLESHEALSAGETTSRFSAGSGALAQHATTSIELSAFGRLSPEQQRLLYPAGEGAGDKQGLFELIAGAAHGDRRGNIDASTRGRNAVGSMVKTPVESILAADPSLAVPRAAQSSGTASVGSSPEDSHALRPVDEVAAEIRERGSFPATQGAHGSGYRAVAEKLQPPLQDTVSGELRVLVEHRTGGLQSAVNQALRGDRSALTEIARAAAAMDRQRRARTGTGTPESEITDSREEASTSGGEREPLGGGIPVIPNPEGPLALPALLAYYNDGIHWANGQGTFSNEFLEFRDHLEAALATLQNGGLEGGTIGHIRATLPGIIAGNEEAAAGYPEPEVQEAVFTELDPAYGQMLWPLLRYLNARH